MKLPKPDFVFDYLNKHIIYPQQTITFPSQGAQEYEPSLSWLFSDLYDLFGSEILGKETNIEKRMLSIINYDVFESLPHKKQKGYLNPTSFADFYNYHVTSFLNKYYIRNSKDNTGPTKTNAKLSRYASWMLMKQFPNMIFSQLYFMTPNASLDELKKQSYNFSRIYLRKNLANAEKIVASILYRYKTNLKKIFHEMNTIFFNDIPIKDIKAKYDILQKQNDPITNYLGAYSILALQTALSSSIEKKDQSRNMSLATFYNILTYEISFQREKLIQEKGIYPEKEIMQTPVKKINSQLKQMERRFIETYAMIKTK